MGRYIYFIYWGGYWENMPVLDRISGPKRFRQYVVDPIPDSIRNLKGGYSGFPQGRVVTEFAYSENFSKYNFIKEWEKLDNIHSTEFLLGHIEEIDATNVYQKKLHESYIYLLINEKNKTGMLLVD